MRPTIFPAAFDGRIQRYFYGRIQRYVEAVNSPVILLDAGLAG